VAAGRRRSLERELAGKVQFDRRAFLLLPGKGQRPTYDEYVVSHRVRAADMMPELGFAIPKVGQKYPSSSVPAQLVAAAVQDEHPDRLEAMEDQLFGAMFRDLRDISDPAELRAAFGIDVFPESVIIAPDIGFYRERKVRLLNGAHTATAPLALLAGVRTVREVAEHPRLGAFLRHILFEEIVPATDLPAGAALAFAGTVIDRFRNPWLDHEWRVIAANQTAKLRLRVVPSLTGFARNRGIAPQGLALGLAAYLRWVRSHPAGDDADRPLIERHWRTATAPQGLAASALADADLWGVNLAELPGLLEATTRWLLLLERDGVDAALEALPGMSEHAATGWT